MISSGRLSDSVYEGNQAAVSWHVIMARILQHHSRRSYHSPETLSSVLCTCQSPMHILMIDTSDILAGFDKQVCGDISISASMDVLAVTSHHRDDALVRKGHAKLSCLHLFSIDSVVPQVNDRLPLYCRL